jgi:hypothetical protein
MAMAAIAKEIQNIPLKVIVLALALVWLLNSLLLAGNGDGVVTSSHHRDFERKNNGK